MGVIPTYFLVSALFGTNTPARRPHGNLHLHNPRWLIEKSLGQRRPHDRVGGRQRDEKCGLHRQPLFDIPGENSDVTSLWV
jgi:hypothetical protein